MTPQAKYNLTNFFGTLLIYGIGVYVFSHIGGSTSDFGTFAGNGVSIGGYTDWKHGFEVMGVISGFVIAYMVTKNFNDKGRP